MLVAGLGWFLTGGSFHGRLGNRANAMTPATPTVVPLVIDPERRLERRDLPRGATIRFVTEEDYPPFNYLGRDGALVGFHIDLARAVCAELAVPCTIQTRRGTCFCPRWIPERRCRDCGSSDHAGYAPEI